jgi:hypothetical protein
MQKLGGHEQEGRQARTDSQLLADLEFVVVDLPVVQLLLVP